MENGGLQVEGQYKVSQKDKDLESTWGGGGVEKGEGILLSWSNLTVKVPVKKPGLCCPGSSSKEPEPARKLLDQVTGQARPGELLAILGASGAGKSTLLNTLAFRNLVGLEVEGKRLANKKAVSTTSLTAVSGYVQQEELFISVLSVTEHLTFQSLVRMPKGLRRSARRERVEEVIKELGLASSADTMIGDLSGGEKRRLSVASELLTDPKLLFCDEPTSGLDSHMAASVVDLLLGLAAQGRTVVCTIHQPSSQVFATFDRLLLLAEGRTAYIGAARGTSKDFFASQGFPCPQDFNPADHLISLLAVEPGNEAEDRARVSLLCDAFDDSELGKEVRAAVQNENEEAGEFKDDNDKVSPYLATWPQQLGALAWRNWKTSLKNPLAARAKIGQAVVLALILGVVYLQQDMDQKGIQNINGALFVLLTNISFGNIFAVVNIFCSELPIFKREHYGGMYRVDTYFIAKQLVDLPLYLVEPVILTSILYWMVGLNPDVLRFFVACGIILLVTQVFTTEPQPHQHYRLSSLLATSSPASPPMWMWPWPSPPSSSSPSCSSADSSSTLTACRCGFPGSSGSPGSSTPTRLCWSTSGLAWRELPAVQRLPMLACLQAKRFCNGSVSRKRTWFAMSVCCFSWQLPSG